MPIGAKMYESAAQADATDGEGKKSDEPVEGEVVDEKQK
jgi:hypothetical protein